MEIEIGPHSVSACIWSIPNKTLEHDEDWLDDILPINFWVRKPESLLKKKTKKLIIAIFHYQRPSKIYVFQHHHPHHNISDIKSIIACCEVRTLLLLLQKMPIQVLERHLACASIIFINSSRIVNIYHPWSIIAQTSSLPWSPLFTLHCLSCRHCRTSQKVSSTKQFFIEPFAKLPPL